MNKILKLKRKDGKIINVQLKNLDITYIDKIMETSKYYFRRSQG